MGFLRNCNVGDIVKVRENGSGVEYIVVNKGVPSAKYGGDGDGVWLIRRLLLPMMAFDVNAQNIDDANNEYEKSAVHAWLNGEFLNTIDEKIRSKIKSLRVPFKKGAGNGSGSVLSGASGLLCKAFLPSAREVGFTDDSYDVALFDDGTALAYFTGNASRIAGTTINSSGSLWSLRSPRSGTSGYITVVRSDGLCGAGVANFKYGLRPVFVLPYDLVVDSEGFVSTNLLPVITADKSGNLGLLGDGFSVRYSVDDSDAADSLKVTLCMNKYSFFF